MKNDPIKSAGPWRLKWESWWYRRGIEVLKLGYHYAPKTTAKMLRRRLGR